MSYWNQIILASALLLSISTQAASVERKIIIQNGQYYYFSIDEESQIAILHTASLDMRIRKEQRCMFPIGRELSEPINPLSFDINGDEFVGVNWILNSMNSRYEALKKMSMKAWSKPRPEWAIDDWAIASFDQPIMAPNTPWVALLEEDNVLEHTFFDLAKNGTQINMMLCNKGKMYLWEYKQGNWRQTAVVVQMPEMNYGSLIYSGATIALIDNKGLLYAIDTNANALKPLHSSAAQQDLILVVDKDKQKNFLLPANAIDAATMETMSDLMQQHAQEIIF